jgi:iron complex transport system ATP-binding protein
MLESTPAAPLLRVDALRFGYEDVPVLDGVSFDLQPGQVTALIGPNGSGKSTLLHLCLGQLLGEGTIQWQGRDVRHWKRRQLARIVAYLPQSPAYEPQQRVVEVLQLGRSAYWGAFGLESTDDARIVNEVAQRLSLAPLLDRAMDQLSGGQRQRVFIGRCLTQQPLAMLLDEPNTFLDLKHQVELGRLIAGLARQRNIAVLMASHDLNLAGAFADRMMLLANGRLLADGPPGQVLDPQLLSQAYDLPMRRLDDPTHTAPLVFPAV